MRLTFIAAALFMGATQTGFAQSIEPAALVEEIEGEETRLLVLGSPHLSNAKAIEEEWLDPLLDRLEAFGPDVILVERMPGWQIEMLAARPDEYGDILARFGDTTHKAGLAAQAALGMTRIEAERALEAGDASTLENVILALAAFEPETAMLYWWSLDASDRVEGDLLNADLLRYVKAFDGNPNESVMIGSALGHRLGLERIYAFDDQSIKDDFLKMSDGFGEAIGASAEMEELFTGEQAAALRNASVIDSADDIMDVYRRVNGDDYAKLDIAVQWLGFLRADMDGYGRQRVAQWETRNLYMAGNARRVMGRYPGSRVLVIVGSAHKPYLDDYLGRMMDVEIVDALSVLE